MKLKKEKKIRKLLENQFHLCVDNYGNWKLFRKYDKMEQRNAFLESRNKILELVESYLPHRINAISNMKDARYDYAILELKKLSDALDMEKEKLENKGDGEDERE